jgi:hypothetical protein
MNIWDNLKESVSGLGSTLKSSWLNATAKPVSFAQMDNNEREILSPIHEDFLDKAKRGYFDEDVIRDYRKFLFRCAFDKADVDRSTAYMKQVAKAALPENARHAAKIQDAYWAATGFVDTRKKTSTPDEQINPPA